MSNAFHQRLLKKLFVSGVFALCAYLVWASITPDLPKPNALPKIYSHPSNEDLRLTFLSAIEKAEKSVFLSMFGLSDPSIIQALSKKDIPVTIFYDKKNSKVLHGDRVFPVSSKGLMHQKILILDDETVFIGSANFTTQSLKMHDNLFIGFQDKEIASFLQENVPLKSGKINRFIGNQEMILHLLPSEQALEDLKASLRGARKTLKIALFTLTHQDLIQEIINAKYRGVDVSVILDMHSSYGASAKALKALEQAGVNVFLSQGLQLMHHKFAYIDDKILISGSANWTKSAFTKNHDCILTLHDLTQEQRNCMNKIWFRLITKSKKKL